MQSKRISMSVRTTVSIEDDLLKLLKLKAVETSRSVSDLLNELIKESFREDSEDLKAFDAREKEDSISFEAFLKELEADGRL